MAKRYLQNHLLSTVPIATALIICGSVCNANNIFGRPANTTMIDRLTEGDDWWLPSGVTQSPNSGIYADLGTANPDAVTLNMSWREINPQENVFDWSKLKKALKGNRPVWLRIFASDVTHCPAWLKAKYPDLKSMHCTMEGGVYRDSINNFSWGRFYPIWHKGLDSEFRKLLSDFKKNHFAQEPNLKFMYVPEAWRWNEWELIFVRQLKGDGYTPSSFYDWFCRHLDAYADAAEGNTYKMVFTGPAKIDRAENDRDWAYELNDIPKGRNRLTDYAVSLGMSARAGAQEFFNTASNIPSWGAPSEAIGKYRYQTIDQTSPLRANPNSIIATEDEGLGDETMIKGTAKPYYMKMATLKALQLRLNWFNLQQSSYDLAPAVVEYARKTMGKTAETSPDAWVALRQWCDPTYLGDKLSEDRTLLGRYANQYDGINNFLISNQLPYRNWERWLIQREVEPDGHTIAAEQIPFSKGFNQWNGCSFEAIRTDHKNGNNYVYFAVDDQFILGEASVLVKVTYLDNNQAKWCLEYDSADGNHYKKTNSIANENSGKWKTATFEISDASFRNSQNGKMDFRLYNGGQDDLTVRFVRLIKA